VKFMRAPSRELVEQHSSNRTLTPAAMGLEADIHHTRCRPEQLFVRKLVSEMGDPELRYHDRHQTMSSGVYGNHPAAHPLVPGEKTGSLSVLGFRPKFLCSAINQSGCSVWMPRHSDRQIIILANRHPTDKPTPPCYQGTRRTFCASHYRFESAYQKKWQLMAQIFLCA